MGVAPNFFKASQRSYQRTGNIQLNLEKAVKNKNYVFLYTLLILCIAASPRLFPIYYCSYYRFSSKRRRCDLGKKFSFYGYGRLF